MIRTAMKRQVIAALFGAFVLGAVASQSMAIDYEGHKLWLNRPGYEKAGCVIEKKNPAVATTVSAWAGLDNGKVGGWMWLQGGWVKGSGWSGPEAYYEYRDESGAYSGVMTQGDPGSGGSSYGVNRSGSNVSIVSDDGVAITLSWSDFDRVPLCGAQFGAEMQGGSGSYTPGSASNPCDFSSAVIREVGGSDTSASFSSSTKNSSAANGNTSDGNGDSFITWDGRS